MLNDSWLIVKVQRIPTLQLGFVITFVYFDLETIKSNIKIGIS